MTNTIIRILNDNVYNNEQVIEQKIMECVMEIN